MAGSALPTDVSLADVVQQLANPVEYLRGIVGNMHECKKGNGYENDDAVVRIGTTGKGRAPHYRIESAYDLIHASVDNLLSDSGDDLSRYYVAFHGSSHKQLASCDTSTGAPPQRASATLRLCYCRPATLGANDRARRIRTRVSGRRFEGLWKSW